jgi:lysozyme
MINGIDVSSVQGITIDWQAVAATGVQFAVIKCGNGNDAPDPDFARNVAGAQNAGLQIVCYHFVYPLPPLAGDPSRAPAAQAQMHFNAAQGVLAACDLEWPPVQNWAQWNCSATQINQWGLDYLAAYSQLSGRPMIIYTYPYFAQTVQLSADYAQYPLWIASYENTPTIPAPWTNWTLWQTTGGGGHLPNGEPVDTDVAPDLSLWGVVNQPVAAPIVAPAPDPIPEPATPPDPVSVPAPSPSIWTSIGNTISQLFRKK